MKPTLQNQRPVRRGESVRPAGHSSIKSPVTDWNFQTSAADLRGSSSSSVRSEDTSAQSFYGLSQAAFTSATKWEDRIETIVVGVVVAIAACPIAEAIYIAARTV